MRVLAPRPTYIYHSFLVQAFYCTLPTSANYPGNRFPATESTTFDTLTDAIYTSLSYANVHARPPLIFKLSTDPKDAPWEYLDSPEDWAYAIRRVYNKKAQQKGKVRRNVDLQIGFSYMVRHTT